MFQSIKTGKLSKKRSLYSSRRSNFSDDGIETVKQHAEDDEHVLDDDDKEIRRLEKLLAIDKKKDRKIIADKLNKEYEEFEGISGGFGDFLMGLDNLIKLTKSTETNKKKNSDSFYKAKQDTSENYENESDTQDDNYDKSNDTTNQYGSRTSYPDDSEDVNNPPSSDANAHNTYCPVAGEDIYGRVVDPSKLQVDAKAKYVPPAMRKQLCTPDTTSEAAVVLRRAMNGLLNRLSENSKDVTARAMKNLFDANALNLSNRVLVDCTLTVCAKPDQTMTTLIPIYASIIAVLHVTVSKEVGAYLTEHLILLLVTGEASDTLTSATNISALSQPVAHKELNNTNTKCHSFISSKKRTNFALILAYLYNFRVLHHELIMDLVQYWSGLRTDKHAQLSNNQQPPTESDLELLSCVVEHCGWQLHKDNPTGVKQIASHMHSSYSPSSSGNLENGAVMSEDGGGRLKFLKHAFSESGIGGRKSSRKADPHIERVKHLRKWISGTKLSLLTIANTSRSSHGDVTGDTCLRVSLFDLLNADKRGRWWRPGASWTGNSNVLVSSTTTSDGKLQPHEDRSSGACKASLKSNISSNHSLIEQNESFSLNDQPMNPILSSASTQEEKQLLKMAKKLKFNTETRRNIFMVIMTSRDVNDAFERLARLDLRGREDREVVRVLLECCAHESIYNPFYAELNTTLCKCNRQYKTTTLYAFWDSFKTLDEEPLQQRRVVNLARYLSHMILAFDVSLAAVRRWDVTDLSAGGTLFLTTLFLALLSADADESTFESAFDRVAAADDCLAVRDSILYFFHNYLKSVPADMPHLRRMEKRRKTALRIMEAMEVLSIARAQSEAKKNWD